LTTQLVRTATLAALRNYAILLFPFMYVRSNYEFNIVYEDYLQQCKIELWTSLGFLEHFSFS